MTNKHNASLTIAECVEIAAQSPLAMGSTGEFDNTLRFLFQERDNEWLQNSLVGHLARGFIGMLSVAQSVGISADQIQAAIQAEHERHRVAIEDKVGTP